jgi:methionine sulfoxide reductase heme-binding subunit
VVVWALALTPFVLLVRRALLDDLGANPIEEITDETGRWALILLLVTLTLTPLRRFTHWNGIVKFRRLVGLFAFFYALLHVSTYFVLDQFFSLPDIAEDVLKRPYITVGFTAFLLLVPLAVTSTKGMIRRLGRRWQTVHRAIYIVAALAVLHFLWSVKLDTTDPIWFGLVLVVLLALRLPALHRPRERAAASPADVEIPA